MPMPGTASDHHCSMRAQFLGSSVKSLVGYSVERTRAGGTSVAELMISDGREVARDHGDGHSYDV